MFKVGDEVSVKGEITKVLESGVVVKTHYFEKHILTEATWM